MGTNPVFINSIYGAGTHSARFAAVTYARPGQPGKPPSGIVMAADEAEIEGVLAAALKQPVKVTLIGWADTMEAAVKLARDPVAERQARPVGKSTQPANTAKGAPVLEHDLVQFEPGALEPEFDDLAPADDPHPEPVHAAAEPPDPVPVPPGLPAALANARPVHLLGREIGRETPSGDFVPAATYWLYDEFTRFRPPSSPGCRRCNTR
jgi:hypothetical protein